MVVMSETPAVREALDAAHEELAVLCGQRNAITARMVDLIARVDAEDLWASAGAKSLEHWVAWKAGMSPAHAGELVAVARRSAELVQTMAGFREGVLSEDQVAIIAKKAPAGPEADVHFAELARYASVRQLRKALRITDVSRPPAPKPEPEPEPDTGPEAEPEPERVERQVSSWFDDHGGWHLRVDLPVEEGAFWDRALRAELEGLVQEHKARLAAGGAGLEVRPFPRLADAFVRLAWRAATAGDAERTPGQRATAIVHVDLAAKVADLHLGPLLSDAERRYLTCDARMEVWFERDGIPIGAGRTTREIPRRLRRALERRDRCCRVCGSTVGLHAHHLVHWEDGGPTELWNLILACPHCHRAHHRGLIRIVGPADRLRIFDRHGRPITPGSVARPPTDPPPDAPPYQHPPGERADWHWYVPPPIPPAGEN